MRDASTSPALGRRTLLGTPLVGLLGTGGVGGAVTLTACGPTGTAVGSADAPRGDEDLLATAVAATDRLAADLTVALRRHPRLRPRLVAVQRVHAGHRAVLASAGEATTAPAPGGGLPRTPSPADAARALSRRESALAGRLVDLAVAADSGPFARVLASCSAAASAAAAWLRSDRAPALLAAPELPALPRRADGSGARTTAEPLEGASGAVAALQAALAAEHAAVWTLGVLGARTSRSARPDLAAALLAAYAAHRDRRDLLDALLRALGEDPAAAAPGYALPRSGSAAQVTASAAALEADCAGWWAALVAASTGATRRLGASALADCAVRELVGRGSPEIFPGADELADR